jgi:hypothetical protein
MVALLRTGRGSGDGGCGPAVRGVLRGRHDRSGAGGQHGRTQAIPSIAAYLELSREPQKVEGPSAAAATSALYSAGPVVSDLPY